jgi:hypothetical protein
MLGGQLVLELNTHVIPTERSDEGSHPTIKSVNTDATSPGSAADLRVSTSIITITLVLTAAQMPF